MYQSYWGFKEKPFENTPDPRFFYATPKHEEALMRMIYAVREHKSAAMLSGEYGSGKTLLTRLITSYLLTDSNKYNVAVIINPDLSSDELLEEIMYQLGKTPPSGSKKGELLRELNTILYSISQQGKHTVIIVDEAQAIRDEKTLEEMRLLLNFQLNDRFLLTLLLFGQPELREKISHVRQFDQRLSLRYHLYTLSESETANYIKYRCQVAGCDKEIFTPDACSNIYLSTGGVPRLINTVCDTSLLVGMNKELHEIDRHIAEEVAIDLNLAIISSK
jgi:type II secretory pathway predicted ATPase ExeA